MNSNDDVDDDNNDDDNNNNNSNNNNNNMEVEEWNSPGGAALSWLGGLCVSMTLRAMLAGDLSPGRATHVRKVKG